MLINRAKRAHVCLCKCAMDDKLSMNSSDSVTTSGEYEIVSEELESQTVQLGTSPTLNIANNGNFNDLEKDLTEVIRELENNTTAMASSVETASRTGQSTSLKTGKLICHVITQ